MAVSWIDLHRYTSVYIYGSMLTGNIPKESSIIDGCRKIDIAPDADFSELVWCVFFRGGALWAEADPTSTCLPMELLHSRFRRWRS